MRVVAGHTSAPQRGNPILSGAQQPCVMPKTARHDALALLAGSAFRAGRHFLHCELKFRLIEEISQAQQPYLHFSERSCRKISLCFDGCEWAHATYLFAIPARCR